MKRDAKALADESHARGDDLTLPCILSPRGDYAYALMGASPWLVLCAGWKPVERVRGSLPTRARAVLA